MSETKDAARPREARFMRLTKSAERQHCSSEEDSIRQAFLPTSYVQLRSLHTRKTASASPRKMQKSSKPWQMNSTGGSFGADGSMQPLNASHMHSRTQVGVVSGTLSPRKHSVARRIFSTFEYLPSEYDLEKQIRTEEKAKHARRIIGPTSIKTGIPTIPDKQGTFTHFRYEVDPYESKEDYWKMSMGSPTGTGASTRKPFTPGGKFIAKDKLSQRKASQHELLHRLIATLTADWPNAFERCFTDKRGLIVCLFSEQQEQDSSGSWPSELLHYMHHLVKTHPVSNEFVLRKMSARWGKKSNGFVEFALQPPWVNVSPYEPYFRSHLEDAAKLKLKKRGALRSADRGIPAVPSRRMAFPPQTPSGARVYSYLPGEGHLNA